MRRTYKNDPEEQFCQWIEERGFTPIKRGWPDFFCLSKDGEIAIVEVKPSPYRMLKREQASVMALLAQYGIPVYRWDPISRKLTSIKDIYKLPVTKLPDTAADVPSY